MRLKQSLNGWWDYRIGNGTFTRKKVPYSALPVGRSECVLKFDRAPAAERKRAFLVFEGITYEATVTLNGVVLGTMLPYCEYRYEISNVLSAKDNILSVEIKDIEPVFGPSEGWENYGGIIRSVYLEYTEALFIEDVVWNGKLSEDYRDAECTVQLTLDGMLLDASGSLTVKAVLLDTKGSTVACATGVDCNLTFTVSDPHLWSPDIPYLYTLECSVYIDGKLTDLVIQRVGFKDLVIKGKRFYLNGEPFFILGVNRHDLWGKNGHTLTEEQMQKDMRMIKENGMNYVRLVHYPHNKRILEIADEIGLLVSEEPGLWWSDMHNPKVCDSALEVMRRTVIRDRNHISIAFWLSFNECDFTLEYLKDSAQVCRENDPYHMVSGANCMSLEKTKENYPICGFDFYTMHPYDSTPARMQASAETLTEMPLLLTEWGGYYCHDNPYLFRQFIDYIISTWRNPEDQPVIAGAVYWYWAEIHEFNRGYPACKDGILKEALVDIDRNPTSNLEVYRTAFSALNLPPAPPAWELSCFPEAVERLCPVPGHSNVSANDHGIYCPVDVTALLDPARQEADWKRMMEYSALPISRFVTQRKSRKLTFGPQLHEEVQCIGRLPLRLVNAPYVITASLDIPVNDTASALYIIGNTSMPKGYPLPDAVYGGEVAKYTIIYADGTETTRIMYNGIDITTSTATFGPSRIEPYADNCPRLMQFHYDLDRERYVINLCKLDTCSDQMIKGLRIHDVKEGYQLLFYGMTLKK